MAMDPDGFLQHWEPISVRELDIWLPLVYAFGVLQLLAEKEQLKTNWLIETSRVTSSNVSQPLHGDHSLPLSL